MLMEVLIRATVIDNHRQRMGLREPLKHNDWYLKVAEHPDGVSVVDSMLSIEVLCLGIRF